MGDAGNDVVEAYRAALPVGEVVDFDLRGLDKLDVPVWSSSWFGRDGGVAHGNGFGVTVEQARTGGYGELAETALSARRVRRMEPVAASHAELLRRRGRDGVVDPRLLCLPAGWDYDADRRLDWLPMVRLRSGEDVLVPAEFVASGPGDLPRRDEVVLPISNGLGAGDTWYRAVGHALLELLQRDGNSVSFRALDRGVVIDVDGRRDPAVATLLDAFASAGVEVLAKLASTDFGVSGVYVVGDDPTPPFPLAVTACGEAAHPDRDVALRKALAEYASSRCRKALAFGSMSMIREVAPAAYLDHIGVPGPQEPRAARAMASWLEMTPAALGELLAPTVRAERRRVRLSELPTVAAGSLADPRSLYDDLLGRLADFDVLTLECSAGGVAVAKVVVPGLEVETMSYDRIGERNARRLLDRGGEAGGDLVGHGEPPAGAATVALTPEATDRLGGPVWFSPRRAAELVGPLYPLYREPDRHALALSAQGAV